MMVTMIMVVRNWLLEKLRVEKKIFLILCHEYYDENDYAIMMM